MTTAVVIDHIRDDRDSWPSHMSLVDQHWLHRTHLRSALLTSGLFPRDVRAMLSGKPLELDDWAQPAACRMTCPMVFSTF